MYKKSSKKSYAPKKYVKKSYAKKTHTKKSYRKKSSASFVRRVITAAAEKKNIVFRAYDYELYPFSAVGTVPQQNCNLVDLYQYTIDQITQGTGQGNRVGNRINVTKFIVSIVYSAVGIGYPTNVRTYFGRLKFKLDPPAVNDFGALYKFGNTNVGPDNLLTDSLSAINNDRWIIQKTRNTKIGRSQNTAAASNNDYNFSKTVKFDLTKYLGGQIQYEDAVATPTNKQGYMFFTIANGDNLAITPPTYAPSVAISFNIDVEFTDI